MSEKQKDEFDRLLDLCTENQTDGDPEKVKTYVGKIRPHLPRRRRRRVRVLLAAALSVTLLLIGALLLVTNFAKDSVGGASTTTRASYYGGEDGEIGDTAYTTTTAAPSDKTTEKTASMTENPSTSMPETTTTRLPDPTTPATGTTGESAPDTVPACPDGKTATFVYLSANGQEVRCRENVGDVESMIRRWIELSGRTDLILSELLIRYSSGKEPMTVVVRFDCREDLEGQGNAQSEYLRESLLATYPELVGVEITIG